MSQPQQTGKRIVSKGEYAKVQGKRARLICLIIGLVFVTFACGSTAMSSLLGSGDVGVVKYSIVTTSDNVRLQSPDALFV